MEDQLVGALSDDWAILLELLLGLDVEFASTVVIGPVEIGDLCEEWPRILRQWMEVHAVNDSKHKLENQSPNWLNYNTSTYIDKPRSQQAEPQEL